MLLLWFFKLNADSGLWGSALQGRVHSARLGEFVAYAWEDARNGDWDIYLSIFKGSSPVIEDIRANPDSSIGDQVRPRLAWSPQGLLAVVWEDRSFEYPKVRFALYDTTGRLLYRGFFADNEIEDESQTSPAVCWAGGYLFIAWERYYLGRRQVAVRRFLPNGAPMSETVILSGDTSTNAIEPTLAGNEFYLMVAWRSFTGTTWDIIYTLTDLELNSYSYPNPILQDGDQKHPTLAAIDSGFILVWASDGELWGKPFNRYGSGIGPSQTISTLGSEAAELAGWGRGDTAYFSFVLDDSLLTLKLDRYLTLLELARVDDSPSGVLHGSAAPDPVWVDARRGEPDVYIPGGYALNAEEPAQLGPTLACAGGECLGFWVDTRGDEPTVYGRSFSGEEFVLYPSGNRQAYPVAEPLGESILVVWQEETSGVYQLLWAELPPSGDTAQPQLLEPSSGDQIHPALAVRESLWAVAWEELGGTWQVRARISNGTLLELGEGSWPKLALGDSALLVLWLRDRELWAQGFNLEGSTLFGPLKLAEDASEPAVASFSGGFAVAWREGDKIKLALISDSGEVSGPLEPAPWEEYQWHPSLSASGDTLLVSWIGWVGYPGVFGRGYAPDGQPRGGFWALVDSCQFPVWSQEAQASPEGIAMVWVDYREGKGADVYGGLFDWNLVDVAEGRGKPRLVLLGSLTEGELRLVAPSGGLAEIYDAAGRLFLKKKLNSGVNSLKLNLKPGVYVLRLGGERAKFVVR